MNKMLAKKSLAILISGRGSNLSVFLQKKNKFKNLWVISNKENAFGLEKAKRFSVKTSVLKNPVDWIELHSQLVEEGIDGIFLAGFMKILPPEFVEQWEEKMFNLHPSLLPDYKGLKSIERAYKDKKAIGVSIHKVTAAVDDGEVLLQEVAVKPKEMENMSLEDVELYTHICEQKLIHQWIEKWV